MTSALKERINSAFADQLRRNSSSPAKKEEDEKLVTTSKFSKDKRKETSLRI